METIDKNILSVKNITKHYGAVIANQKVSLELGVNKIHALLGENGAGKSTLVKIIYGLVKPDSGSMLLNGKNYTPENPKFARKMGIGF